MEATTGGQVRFLLQASGAPVRTRGGGLGPSQTGFWAFVGPACRGRHPRLRPSLVGAGGWGSGSKTGPVLHGGDSPLRAIFFLGDSGCGGLFICWGQVGPGQAWQRPRTGFSLPCRISGFEEGDHHCCLSPRLGTHHLRHLLTHTHLLSFD